MSHLGWVPAVSQVLHCDVVLRPQSVLDEVGDWLHHQQLFQWCAKFSDSILECIWNVRWWDLRKIRRCRHPWWGWAGFNFSHLRDKSSWAKMAVPFWLWMFAHIILASASTASSKMSAKHQENDTPVKASHLLLVVAVCPVLVPEHCQFGEPPKHEKFVSFHKSSVEWWPFVTYPQPKDRGHHSPKPQDASVQGS